MHRDPIFVLDDFHDLEGIGPQVTQLGFQELYVWSFEVWEEVLSGVPIGFSSSPSVSGSPSGTMLIFIWGVKVIRVLDNSDDGPSPPWHFGAVKSMMIILNRS